MVGGVVPGDATVFARFFYEPGGRPIAGGVGAAGGAGRPVGGEFAVCVPVADELFRLEVLLDSVTRAVPIDATTDVLSDGLGGFGGVRPGCRGARRSAGAC